MAAELILGTNEPSWLWNRDMGGVKLFLSRNRFARRKTYERARPVLRIQVGDVGPVIEIPRAEVAMLGASVTSFLTKHP